jgi:hypothetical protein
VYLDILRSALGVPLMISSGYRCAAHNAEVGGAPSSRHLIGCAADVLRPAKLKYSVFSDTAKRLLLSDDWEFIRYNTEAHIHVGVPRGCSDKIWDGGKIKLCQ